MDTKTREWAAPAKRNGLPTTVAALGLIVLLVLIGLGALARWRPEFPNPFATRTVDRSQPVLLRSIQNLSVYKAATANFQVIVDLEKDTPLIPSLIKGQRTLFVAAGSVDAEVDFSKLASSAIKVSADRRTATITLPRAQLSQVRIDVDHSYVFSRQRGVLDRIGSVFADDSNSLQQLYQLAEVKLATAAQQSGVLDRAEQNTRATLEGMLHSLGYTNVIVNFIGPTSPPK
jgi:hypothetical protein